MTTQGKWSGQGLFRNYRLDGEKSNFAFVTNSDFDGVQVHLRSDDYTSTAGTFPSLEDAKRYVEVVARLTHERRNHGSKETD